MIFGGRLFKSLIVVGQKLYSSHVCIGINFIGSCLFVFFLQVFLCYPNNGKIDKFKIDDPSPRSIIRNAASGNNNALVKAVYKDRNLKELVLVEAINDIKKEIRQYAKDPECLLKLKSPEDIQKLSNQSLYQQLLWKCPKLVAMIGSTCQPGKIKSLPPLADVNDHKFINSVCMAASVCLHQYNQMLSATHYRISLLLLNGGAKALTLERCAHLGISVSHSSAIRMQSKASSPQSTKATTWREDTYSKTLQVRFLEEAKLKQLANEVNLSLDEVQSYANFSESVHTKCCSMLQTATGDESSVVFKSESIDNAIQELKKNTVHYKYVIIFVVDYLISLNTPPIKPLLSSKLS